jgi:hypothetical protein
LRDLSTREGAKFLQNAISALLSQWIAGFFDKGRSKTLQFQRFSRIPTLQNKIVNKWEKGSLL